MAYSGLTVGLQYRAYTPGPIQCACFISSSFHSSFRVLTYLLTQHKILRSLSPLLSPTLFSSHLRIRPTLYTCRPRVPPNNTPNGTDGNLVANLCKCYEICPRRTHQIQTFLYYFHISDAVPTPQFNCIINRIIRNNRSQYDALAASTNAEIRRGSRSSAPRCWPSAHHTSADHHHTNPILGQIIRHAATNHATNVATNAATNATNTLRGHNNRPRKNERKPRTNYNRSQSSHGLFT